MTRAVALLSLALALAAAGCGDDPGTPCATGATADGALTLALGDTCVRGALHARRGGAWAPGTVDATLTPDDAGGVVLDLAAAGPVEGLALTLPDLPADRMLQQGWQSWSWVGTVTIPTTITLHADGLPLAALPDSGDPIEEEHGVGYHATVLRLGPDGPYLALAALRAERAATAITAVRAASGAPGAADVTVLWGPQREVIGAAGDTVAADPLYAIAAATAEDALAALSAALVAEHAGAPAPRQPPAGWYSWNERFVDIDEAYIEAHIDVVEAELAPLGMDLVEIDDGWEVAWGDWTAGPSFPSGMPAIADAITTRGLTAGIWMAPLLVDVESAAAQGDPARFVRGPDGQPLVHRLTGNTRDFYVVDATHPDGLAIATAPLADLAAAGFTYFKLDFLYAGAFAGQRQDDVTGVEALRVAMAAFRQAVGPDAVIEACGSPTLPVIGVADALRFGADTAFDGFDLDFALVGWMARALAGRAHLWPLIWLDADQVQVRAPYSAVEARTGALLTALAGPAYALGDDLTVLPDDRLAIALDPAVLDLAATDAPARAIGVMDEASPEIVGSPILEAFRAPAGVLVAPAARFEVTGGSGARYELTVDWNGDHATTVVER